MATIRIELEITKDQLLEIIQETSFSKPEIKQILLSLFPHRETTDNARLIEEISEFLYNWCHGKENRRNIQHSPIYLWMPIGKLYM